MAQKHVVLTTNNIVTAAIFASCVFPVRGECEHVSKLLMKTEMVGEGLDVLRKSPGTDKNTQSTMLLAWTAFGTFLLFVGFAGNAIVSPILF